MLKDIMLDVAKNIAGLGSLQEILVEQKDNSTKFTAYDQDSSLNVLAHSKNKVVEFPDSFGLFNLSFFVGLTELYRGDDGTVTTGTNSKNDIDRLIFSNKDNNKDEYRLTPVNLMKTTSRNFNGTAWDVVVQPAANKIGEFSQRAGLYSNIDPNVILSTDKGKLVFTFGGTGGGGHIGKFAFADTTQVLKRSVTLPISSLLIALKVASQGTPVLSISEKVSQVSFDSGVISYEYLVPSQS